jgi:hypothetical protein
LLIVRASRPRATRPFLREFVSSWALVIFFIACNVAIGKAFYLKWLASKSFASFHLVDWFGLLVFGFFFWLGISVLLASFRQRELMRNGEVAVASVLSQATHARSGSWVTYSFEDAHGIRQGGGCYDRTRELSKGMSYLVFYEGEQPTRRVASCDCDFEIVLPNEE